MEVLAIIRNFFSIAVSAGMALCLAAFFWGLVRYIVGGGDEVERSHGKNLMLNSLFFLIGLMVLWAFLAWIRATPQ